jgi:hypothetical protein
MEEEANIACGCKERNFWNCSARVLGNRAWGSYCCGIVVWWFITLRLSMSIRLWLTVELPSLILMSPLRTLSLSMTFLLTKTTLVEANPCVRLIVVIGQFLKGYC